VCLEKLRAGIDGEIRQRDIGAILVEPIRGRGGFGRSAASKNPAYRGEILTGFNRTGALLACEHLGVVPDIVCLGKLLTSGFPLSACVGRADIMDAWSASAGEALYTSTFLGNRLDENPHGRGGRVHGARERAKLTAVLRAVRSLHIGDVRGAGLMLGVDLVEPDKSAPAT